jgi:hypothetical protein
MKKWREDWENIQKEIESIQKNCAQLNVEYKGFKGVEEITQEFLEQLENWKLYDEFLKTLQNMEEKEWILFKRELFSFQDFTTEWTEKLRQNNSREPIVYYLRHQIE